MKYIRVICCIWILLLCGCAQTETVTQTETALQTPLAVPQLSQYPELPTGCEATAAAMVLQYHGEAVTPQEVAGEWLARSEAFYTENGVQYGPNPNKVFAGDPFSRYAYGCFAPVIADAVNGHSARCTATVLREKTLQELYDTYVAAGKPLLIWATMKMREVKDGNRWRLSDGTDFVWPAREHCLVLVGSTETDYLFNDPQTGGRVHYEKGLCEQRFQSLGRQAVYIDKEAA